MNGGIRGEGLFSQVLSRCGEQEGGAAGGDRGLKGTFRNIWAAMGSSLLLSVMLSFPVDTILDWKRDRISKWLDISVARTISMMRVRI